MVRAENDRKLLNSVLETIVAPDSIDLTNAKVLADAGYWDPEQLALADSRGFETYVPDQDGSNIKQKGQVEDSKPKIIAVTLEGENRAATCNGGKSIRAAPTIRAHKDKNRGDSFYIFPTQRDGTCLECSMRDRCFPLGRTKKSFTMSVMKASNYRTIRLASDRLASPKGREVFSRRMPLIERTFAEIKATMGFRKFLRRGLDKVSLEWTVLCMAYNLRRMHAVSLRQG